MTRSQFKDFAEQEVFEESSNLKLMLEDQAVELLNEELKAHYCDDKHIIDEVLWRGKCAITRTLFKCMQIRASWQLR